MSNRRRRRRGKSMRAQVFKNKKDLKRINDAIEYKFFDLATTEVACNTIGVLTLLNPVPGGSDIQTRDGIEV